MPWQKLRVCLVELLKDLEAAGLGAANTLLPRCSEMLLSRSPSESVTYFYGGLGRNASPIGPENGNADSPLHETEGYNLTNRTQPRDLEFGSSERGAWRVGWIDTHFNPNCATKYLLFICQRLGNIYHWDPRTK